jgi:hypothetical protein
MRKSLAKSNAARGEVASATIEGMGAQRRGKAGRSGTRRLLLADAGMLAGFRRATASLDQMDEALTDLASDDLTIVVLADASLRRDLEDGDQDRFERYRGDGTVTCAAAGSDGGHTGFMRAVAERACRNGQFDEVLVLTARDLGTGGWTLARLGRVDGRWSLLGATPTQAA